MFVREIFVFLTQSISTETKNEWLLWLLGQNELSVVVNVKSFALNSIQSSGILIKERLSWFPSFFFSGGTFSLTPKKTEIIRPRNRSGGSVYPSCHIFLVSNILKYFQKKPRRSRT